MKINIDKNIVEFLPENPQETAQFETLWRIVVDCARYNKKMTPIGNYIPQAENLARFVIEGVQGGVTQRSETIHAETDCTYLCAICNKYMNVKNGEAIPFCCGKLMEPMD